MIMQTSVVKERCAQCRVSLSLSHSLSHALAFFEFEKTHNVYLATTLYILLPRKYLLDRQFLACMIVVQLMLSLTFAVEL